MQNSTPSLKVRIWYYIMRNVNKKFSFNEIDRAYWEAQGLIQEKPWS
jgi:hypothetical protein